LGSSAGVASADPGLRGAGGRHGCRDDDLPAVHGHALGAENPKSFTRAGKADPYPALFKGTEAYAILNGFPWEKLQFLPLDYGKK